MQHWLRPKSARSYRCIRLCGLTRSIYTIADWSDGYYSCRLGEQNEKASIKDVARLADVSIATVSQILNNKGDRFSEATREKVFAARDEVGYVPNISARSLKRVTTC
ncbi:Galactose operon repressor [Weissella viridescens]|uniref:Galactose operon repressor n=1 Tax=Weissella viridescens TaxID=1629 RepID=A0A380P2S2_WEIVI|nr:Galactose operon repressor [Weissella viridescens]